MECSPHTLHFNHVPIFLPILSLVIVFLLDFEGHLTIIFQVLFGKELDLASLPMSAMYTFVA
jgi:hypothetical protein